MTKELEELISAFTRWLNAEAALKEKLAGEEEPKKVITLTPEHDRPDLPEVPGIVFTIEQLANKTGVCAQTIRNLLRRGQLPIVGARPVTISGEGFDPEFRDLYRPFHLGAIHRSDKLKECRISIRRVNDPAVRGILPVEWYLDTSEGAINQRIYKACTLGQLHSYTLSNVGFVNLDELRKFALWWVETRHQPNKDETRAFDTANSAFCVHENDLIWSRTRQWYDQFNPAPHKVSMVRERYRNKGREIDGTWFYLPETLSELPLGQA